MTALFWMHKAYELAQKALSKGEVPIGAVLVDEHQQLIGSGYNQVIKNNDPTAHAEICALRMAGLYLENYRLENTTLYVTLEPCSMCAGAIIHARIRRLVFAVRDFKTGAAGSVCNLFKQGLGNHQVLLDEGIMERECSELITGFFKSKRGSL